MNHEALQRAKDGLQIQDVFLAASSSSLAVGFDPKFDPRIENMELELRHIPKRSYLINGTHEGEEISIFRVEIEAGARQTVAFNGQEGEEAQPEVLVRIEATFMADYLILDPALFDDREALDSFALANASYHVWPYWREFLSTQAVRMNLPKIMLPIVQFPKSKN